MPNFCKNFLSDTLDTFQVNNEDTWLSGFWFLALDPFDLTQGQYWINWSIDKAFSLWLNTNNHAPPKGGDDFLKTHILYIDLKKSPLYFPYFSAYMSGGIDNRVLRNLHLQ